MGMAWLRWVLGASLILTITLLLGWIGFRLHQRLSPSTAPRQVPSATGLEFTGLKHTFIDGLGRRHSVQTDRLVHRKRRLGPLTINPVTEIELHGVRLIFDAATYERPASEAGDQIEGHLFATIHQSLRELLEVHDFGFVSRVVMVGVDIELSRAGEREFHLHAGRARFGPSEQGLELEDVELISRAGAHLQTPNARWNPLAGRLVTGPYLSRRDGHVSSGDVAAVSLTRSGDIVID